MSLGYPLVPAIRTGFWQYELVPDLNGGLNTQDNPERLETNELFNIANIIFKKKQAMIDTGYSTFAGVVRGIPQRDYQFFHTDGTQELVLITTCTLYRYLHSAWEFVPAYTPTTMAAPAIAGALVIVVTSATHFAIGKYIGIRLDSGVEFQVLIDGVAGTTITLHTALPSGVAALKDVTLAVVLTGGIESPVDVVTYAPTDWMVFTNNHDHPQYYDGDTCQDVTGLPSVGDFVAKSVAVYNAALWFFNTVEGGVAYPQHVWRSDIGDPTTWTIGGASLAGFDNLIDTADEIQCGRSLGAYLIVYKERSIYRGQFVDTGGEIYHFDQMVSNEGAISSGAVVDMSDHHVVFGNFSIYEYRAGFDVTNIGERIYYNVFGSQGNLNPSTADQVLGLFVDELDEIWFFYTSTGQTYNDQMIRYNVRQKNWSIRNFTNKVSGFGAYRSIGAKTWSDLVGDWLAQTWQWNSKTVVGSSPTIHLCDPVNLRVYEYDYLATTDNSATISAVMETRDFLVPDGVLRFDMLECEVQGTNVKFEYSPDAGVTWTEFDDSPISNNIMDKARLWQQFVTDKIRFRFSSSNPGFIMNWYAFSYKKESLYG